MQQMQNLAQPALPIAVAPAAALAVQAVARSHEKLGGESKRMKTFIVQ